MSFSGNGSITSGAMGLMLTGGGIAVYVYGLLAFIDYMVYPTAFNAFRAWKINFLVTWITVGVAASQVVTFLVAIPSSLSTVTILLTWGGVGFSAIGLWLMWSMKQLWILEDPDRTLAYEYFDVFGEPETDPNAGADEAEEKENSTAIDDTVEEESETADTTEEVNAGEDTTTTTDGAGDGTTDSTTDTTETTKTSEPATNSTSTETSEPAPIRRRRWYSNPGAFMSLKDLAIAF